MEVFANYIPVVLIVLAIFAANWRTTVQFGHITMNMATKEDIRDLKNMMANVATKDDIKELKDEFRELRNEIKDMKNDI